MLSVIIPARNEQDCIASTIRDLARTLVSSQIEYEIIVVNDGSSDGTEAVVHRLYCDLPSLHCVDNTGDHGLGRAVRRGLQSCRGDTVVVVMADGSDQAVDVVRFYHKIQDGYDCVFGTRFCQGGAAVGYPLSKLILNRIGNRVIQLLFWISYSDVTCSFKMYRQHVITSAMPLRAPGFAVSAELALKAIRRGYSYVILPNTWRNRESGMSKFSIHRMFWQYLVVMARCRLT